MMSHPVKVSRKWGNRTGSARRVVLHQNPELGYVIAIGMFPSLARASKSTKTVLWGEPQKNWKTELHRVAKTVHWPPNIPPPLPLLQHGGIAGKQLWDRGCISHPAFFSGRGARHCSHQWNKSKMILGHFQAEAVRRLVCFCTLLPSQGSDAVRTWPWKPWAGDGGAQDQRNQDSSESP